MAKNKTEIHVTTVFDGELDATDVNWKLNSNPIHPKLELSIAKYILEVSVANLLISSYSCGSAIESGWRYPRRIPWLRMHIWFLMKEPQ